MRFVNNYFNRSFGLSFRNISVFIIITLAIFLSSCSQISGSENPPSSPEEFEAEARILAMEDGLSIEDARISLSRVYTDFADEEFGYFAPMGRYIEFINCTSTMSPDVFTAMGRTVVVYSYRGSIKRITLRDSCSDRFMSKFYCVGDRPAFIRHRCSSVCWQDEHCR